MDERDFELLEVLEKTKNITRAAEMLYVSQSSLSKRINAIERELGITIILRSRQGIRFTPDGERVLYHTQRCSKELKKMRESFASDKNTVSGTLNLGISKTYALYELSNIMLEYRNKFADVNVHIITDTSENLFEKIRTNSIDIAVIRGDYPWNDGKILLSSQNMCAIRSKEHKHIPLNKLSYINRHVDRSYEMQVIKWKEENNICENQSPIFVDSLNACIEMADKGLGWAIVPEICLADFKGDIQALEFKNGSPFTRETYLLYSQISSSLPQANAFIDTIKNYHHSS